MLIVFISFMCHLHSVPRRWCNG